MLTHNQILKNTKSVNGAFGSEHKKKIESSLTLTSLVDCFTTILVYLLLACSFGGAELQIPKHMSLPTAAHSTNLAEGLVVVIDNGQYTLESGHKKSTVAVNQLFDALRAEKRTGSNNFIVVQADKHTRFSEINPAVLTALQAGFKQVRFAVLQEDAN